jgi:hypothetical protein
MASKVRWGLIIVLLSFMLWALIVILLEDIGLIRSFVLTLIILLAIVLVVDR